MKKLKRYLACSLDLPTVHKIWIRRGNMIQCIWPLWHTLTNPTQPPLEKVAIKVCDIRCKVSALCCKMFSRISQVHRTNWIILSSAQRKTINGSYILIREHFYGMEFLQYAKTLLKTAVCIWSPITQKWESHCNTTTGLIHINFWAGHCKVYSKWKLKITG